jgi:phosphatidylinositol-bisphosphatase
MEKLSFQPPSRALWHDHIFFLGDFNYRLTIPRVQVEHFVKTEAYSPLLQYDQLKKEHTEGRVFREFNEGPIKFPPTYKYDIGSDEYDTSEKARTPSYTDRILWRSITPDVQTKQLYYGRAEVKTSDHRPVSSMFDVEIEICDDGRMYQEYRNIYKRFTPSNAVIIFDMRSDLISRKNSVIEEFESYVKRKYGLDIPIVDRLYEKNKNKIFKFILFFFGGRGF